MHDVPNVLHWLQWQMGGELQSMTKLECTHKIGTDSVVEQVLEQITQWILDGRLHCGDKIPTETELSQRLGVSRNSVREAIKILVYLGVLEIRRAQGTFVCCGASVRMLNPMIYQILLSGAADSRRDVMQIRQMIETGVVELALQQRTQTQLSLLKEKLCDLGARIDACDDVGSVFEADLAFHDVIMQMTHNPLVCSVGETVNLVTRGIRYQTVAHLMTTPQLRRKFYQAHARLYTLIDTQNAAGESVGQVVRGTYNLPDMQAVFEDGADF